MDKQHTRAISTDFDSLVRNARSTSKAGIAAMDMLIEECNPMILEMADKMVVPELFADAVQAGYLGLLLAVRDYQRGHGPFLPFAENAIRFEILNLAWADADYQAHHIDLAD